MSYLLLKQAHVGLVALSFALFLLRGAWMLADSPLLKQRIARTLPHLVDTLLLATALGLAIWSRQSPANSPWLAAKLAALLAYIVLGAFAIKYDKTKPGRCAALAAALLCFGYVAGTALTKNPLFFL